MISSTRNRCISATTAASTTVAIINSDDNWISLLRKMFELSKVAVVSLCLPHGPTDPAIVLAFLRRHDPSIVVYDVTPPTAAHWDFIHAVQRDDSAGQRCFVLTTQNEQALMEQVGRVDVLEVTRDIPQLAQLGRVVREALQDR